MNTTSSTPRELISSERVEGTAVYGSDGRKLGTVEELMIDKRSGQVCYAVLEFGGFLGLGSDRYPLPWSTMTYDTDKGGYVVSLDKRTLEGAPRFAETETPDYTPEYNRRVHDYYGLPPLL